VEPLHSAAADNPSNCFSGGVDGRVDRRLHLGVLAFDDDAWQRAEDDLDTASLIRAASRPIDIGQTNGDSLDGPPVTFEVS